MWTMSALLQEASRCMIELSDTDLIWGINRPGNECPHHKEGCTIIVFFAHSPFKFFHSSGLC